jgi:hypothetical protein
MNKGLNASRRIAMPGAYVDIGLPFCHRLGGPSGSARTCQLAWLAGDVMSVRNRWACRRAHESYCHAQMVPSLRRPTQRGGFQVGKRGPASTASLAASTGRLRIEATPCPCRFVDDDRGEARLSDDEPVHQGTAPPNSRPNAPIRSRACTHWRSELGGRVCRPVSLACRCVRRCCLARRPWC